MTQASAAASLKAARSLTIGYSASARRMVARLDCRDGSIVRGEVGSGQLEALLQQGWSELLETVHRPLGLIGGSRASLLIAEHEVSLETARPHEMCPAHSQGGTRPGLSVGRFERLVVRSGAQGAWIEFHAPSLKVVFGHDRADVHRALELAWLAQRQAGTSVPKPWAVPAVAGGGAGS